jgi:hypothetical protein
MDIPFEDRKHGYHISLVFTWNGNKLATSQIVAQSGGKDGQALFAADWSQYEWTTVLEDLGTPSTAEFQFIPATEPGASLRFSLSMSFERHGVSVNWEGPQPEAYLVCPGMRSVDLLVLGLSIPTGVQHPAPRSDPGLIRFTYSTEEVTGMSLQEFAQKYAGSSPDVCFKLPQK